RDRGLGPRAVRGGEGIGGAGAGIPAGSPLAGGHLSGGRAVSLDANTSNRATDGKDSPRAGSVAAPIADLSYRNYDRRLYSRSARWWIIAVSRIRFLRGKWWFWLLIVM